MLLRGNKESFETPAELLREDKGASETSAVLLRGNKGSSERPADKKAYFPSPRFFVPSQLVNSSAQPLLPPRD